MITRLLAAAPDSHTRIDVMDLADALGPLTGYLQAHMTHPAITAHTEVDERLQYLATLAELAALQDDPGTTRASGRVVVITDPGYGFPPEAVQTLTRLINNGAGAAITVLFAGDHTDAISTSAPLLRNIAEHCHRIRLQSDDAAMLDPWTQIAWRFVPDTLALGQRLTDMISTLPSPSYDPIGEPPW